MILHQRPEQSLSPLLLHSCRAGAPGLDSPVSGAGLVVWMEFSNVIFVQHLPRVTGVTNILRGGKTEYKQATYEGVSLTSKFSVESAPAFSIKISSPPGCCKEDLREKKKNRARTNLVQEVCDVVNFIVNNNPDRLGLPFTDVVFFHLR